MDNVQISEIAERHCSLREHFAGVFSRDQLPETLARGYFYVVNSANYNEPGRHWLGMYVNENEVEFMDSFANEPETYGIHIEYPLIMNARQLQSDDSDTCGDYVMYFLYFRSLGLSFPCILSSFRGDRYENDVSVRNLVSLL